MEQTGGPFLTGFGFCPPFQGLCLWARQILFAPVGIKMQTILAHFSYLTVSTLLFESNRGQGHHGLEFREFMRNVWPN